MHEINRFATVRSVSVFVGAGRCNGKCKHCAGLIHRKYAPTEDGIIDEELIKKTLIYCHDRGARSLSVSSSGEPTISPGSVTRLLQIVEELKGRGIRYEKINLYSNGIKIGEDENFVEKYLRLWAQLGLTTIYITVHNTDEKENAKIYGVPSYPCLKTIVSRIHSVGVLVRANVVLSKRSICTLENFSNLVISLKEIGFDNISAWPIRSEDDTINTFLSPSKQEMEKIYEWANKNTSDKFIIRVLGEDSHKLYETGQKLTLFSNGKLSNSWCNN